MTPRVDVGDRDAPRGTLPGADPSASRWVPTAGRWVGFVSELPWVGRLIEEGAAGLVSSAPLGNPPGLDVVVERRRERFGHAGWHPLTRGAWRRGGEVLVENVCASGFDLLLDGGAERPRFTYRWRPDRRERAGRALLPSRFHLLARAALLQYPALWVAGTEGHAPVHAAVVARDGVVALLGGPGGLGKTTLVARELAAGGTSSSDNLGVSDGTTVWGLVEPIRSDDASGRRMPHGRREGPVTGHVPSLSPTVLVFLRRAADGVARVEPCPPGRAIDHLVAGTYMAGELSRYWAFAATLAWGTGRGPVHPPLRAVAQRLAWIRAVEVHVPWGWTGRLIDLLAAGVAP